MSQRFFVETPIVADMAELIDSEAHHLLHVMRAGIGDEVTLFDGGGSEFPARVVKLQRATVQLEIVDRRPVDRELPVALTLAVALPKGDRQKWLIEKATELGVARLVPLATRRGVAQPEPSAIERLRRSVIEASKQCGRNRLMEIARACEAKAYFAAAPVESVRVIAHPPLPQTAGKTANRESTNLEASSDQVAYVAAIGPEGGFTDDELQAAVAAGWQTVSLGSRILRVETAAVALAATIAAAVDT